MCTRARNNLRLPACRCTAPVINATGNKHRRRDLLNYKTHTVHIYNVIYSIKYGVHVMANTVYVSLSYSARTQSAVINQHEPLLFYPPFRFVYFFFFLRFWRRYSVPVAVVPKQCGLNLHVLKRSLPLLENIIYSIKIILSI